MSSVLSAETSTTPRTTASTALLGSGRSSAGCPSQLGSFGLMTKSMSAIKTSTRPRLKAAPPTLVARAIATTKASMLHAVTSPTAAQAVAVLPRDVLKNTVVLQNANQHRESGDAHGDPHEQGKGKK